MEWKVPTKIFKSSRHLIPHQSFFIKFSKPHYKTDYSNANICLVNDDGHMVCDTFNPLLSEEDDGLILSSPVPLTKISSVLVSPQSTRWDLDWIEVGDETGVVKKFTKNNDEFSDNNVLFTLDVPNVFDAEKYEHGMVEYERMKTDILQMIIKLTFIGDFVVGLCTHFDQSWIYFGTGSIIGYFYQFILQLRVDNIGKNYVMAQMLSWLFGSFALVALFSIHQEVEMKQKEYLFAILGFMMNKLAVYIVANKNR